MVVIFTISLKYDDPNFQSLTTYEMQVLLTFVYDNVAKRLRRIILITENNPSAEFISVWILDMCIFYLGILVKGYY